MEYILSLVTSMLSLVTGCSMITPYSSRLQEITLAVTQVTEKDVATHGSRAVPQHVFETLKYLELLPSEKARQLNDPLRVPAGGWTFEPLVKAISLMAFSSPHEFPLRLLKEKKCQ